MPVARSLIFDSPWCRLVAQPLDGTDPYYMLEVPDYVAIVARTTTGGLVLVRQHRMVVGRDTIELPSGHVDPGERPEEAARRELREETGICAGGMELLGVLTPDIGRLVNRMWCYFVGDVTAVHGHVSRDEGLTAVEIPEGEALAMASDGRMEHALNVAVLFLAMVKGKLRA